MKIICSALIFAAALMSTVAHAAAIWEFEETGSDVVGTLSGSLNLTGATLFAPDTFLWTILDPSTARLTTAGGVDVYLFSGPSSIGPGGPVAIPGSTTLVHSGDPVNVLGSFGRFTVPDTYASEDPLSGMITYTGTDLSALGITPGTYIYTLPSDTLTLVFSEAPLPGTVPLPAALPLFLLGLSCAGAAGLLGSKSRSA